MSTAARGSAAVLGAAVLWGTVGPAQVLAASGADPLALGAARLVVGGFVLLGLVGVRGRLGRWRTLGRGPALGWLLLAAASTAAYQAAFLSSVVRTGAALSTVVALGVAPPAVGVLARLTGGERLTRPWLLGTFAAVAGTAVLLLPGATVHIDTAGVLLGILGGLCYGAYTVAAKRLLDGPAPALVAVSATLILGGAALLPFAHDLPRLAEPNSLALVGWLAVPATTLGYLLFVSGLRHVTAATAGTLSLAEPLIAAVLGLAFLGEHLPWPAGVGATLLLAGLVVATVPTPAQPDTTPVATPSRLH
ncbi:DME family drug/metabolite transporter [Amycolatopsis bartoniae]|uniref:Transporter n=1 Tax=Amycolatopsis bartoniae TaxID=941986 RepID=A0A8H9IWK5_9PSEU|nr:EamA family transporter [Amycolatopsis bartoniae]MBB2938537.1 DME family drug/metabolite transporter [Amycolatopsis bartoniae]TVT10322.1 EamA family transporter [Amycolatopsis bartoniae]GHF70297.1 transporter [Amycolatopsis bartoniae]